NRAQVQLPVVDPVYPYPTRIYLANVPGLISKITVALDDFSYSSPDDLDVLLSGPGGTRVILMSDAGGNNAMQSAFLRFDSAAANALPDSGQINSGAYRPTDYPPSETLPLPAPAGPYGVDLAAFNGLDPNGAWELYAETHAFGGSGALNSGWRLTIT